MKEIEVKSIITKNKDNWWFGADYNMNIYRGCCHGCIYCDSRSSCYRVENFDEVRVKVNALELLNSTLASKKSKGIIATGAMSDPYNPFEKSQKMSRGALEIIQRYGFGIAIATKSQLITRDADLLSEISRYAPVIAKLSITTADDNQAKIIEPQASSPSERFAAIEKLASHGIYSGVLMMPILPFIQDNEENIVSIVNKAYNSGAGFIYPMIGMTLRDGSREYFYQALDKHFPDIKQR